MFCALLDTGAWPQLQWVEVRTSFQIPTVCLIGLPGPAVGEARERVRSGIEASGLPFPKRRIVVNLTPASARKHSTGVDLAIALSIVAPDHPDRVAAWGEVGLQGDVKSAGQPVRMIVAAVESNVQRIIFSKDDQLSVEGLAPWLVEVFPRSRDLQIGFAANIREALDMAHGRRPISLLSDWVRRGEATRDPIEAPPLPLSPGLLRVLSISIVGRHHLLLLGTKGTGKSTALEIGEQLLPEVAPSIQIRNRLLAELESPDHPARPSQNAPVRRVGPDVRPQALLGRVSAQGAWIRPGELTRAHGGVLVANEFLEWARDSREILREPLELRRVGVDRAAGSATAPADFVFWASSNLCPCGDDRCRCPRSARDRYLSRLSGPVLDRIDLLYALAGQPDRRPFSISAVRDSLVRAQDLLLAEFGALSCQIEQGRIEALAQAADIRGTNLRGRHARARLALSLAALEGCLAPQDRHFAEAAALHGQTLRVNASPSGPP